ncbi:MAG: ATP-binding cassette domain-containing protein [Candidatus Cloacimonetes bacterium]|nr:ATP-binding cassette domain-containing protein [Candidatus Cloacimonadota bacterium]
MLKPGNPKANQERLKKTIDMVTRLYVSVLKSDTDISSNEINILYSLLTNLFSQVDVSWEAYVRQIIDSEYRIEDVLEHLDKHLSQLDKIRLIQSLVIMAKSEGDFAISEITEIMDLARQLQLPPEVFLPLIDYFESNSNQQISIPCKHHVSHVRHSVFSDYVVFGSGNLADIRFRNPELLQYETAVFAIDRNYFLSVGVHSHILIDGSPPPQNSIILLAPQSTLELGGKEFSNSCLHKIYEHRSADDDIVFRKSNYDFIVHKEKHWYSIQVYGGSVALNAKEMSHIKRHEIYYDDRMQIKGYAPFDLSMVIEAREVIGVEDHVPQKLYILRERDYFGISRTEADNSIATIELKGNSFFLNPPRKGFKIFVNRKEVNEPSPLNLNSDILTIEKRNYRINNYYDLIETPFEIQSLSVTDIKHYFPDGKIGLDSVSFEARKGQLIAIMGQSGCGKSTLTKVLSTEISPTYGQILIDGKNLSLDVNYYLEFLGYVPQEDLLYPNLSVYENLYYRLRLRNPLLPQSKLQQKVQIIMQQVNLSHHRDTIVGEQRSKNLSGGERKRLNIALELLFEPTIIICDEPTSGLSFNDAEQIIDILSALTQQGKIVIITIHQPNSSIYRKFDRVMMMDMGGRVAFYGTPQYSFEYFDEELGLITTRKAEIDKKRQLLTSDYFYDLITYPEYNERGEPVYQQIEKTVQMKRKFPPEYWRDKFKRKMLFEMIQSDVPDPGKSFGNVRKRKRIQDLRSSMVTLITFISRSFKMKLRNRTNNIITFIEAPILALLISFILRHSTTDQYSYQNNNNIFIYIFVSIIAFIFLGMSNSIEEILSERKILLRERLMNLRLSYYQGSKLLTLSCFSLVQAILYHLIAAHVLGIRGLDFVSIGYFFLASFIGVSIGLMCSAFIRENRAIINLLPLILIPQIIFGGAVIEFERMNQNLKIYEKHPIPEVVQIIPSRWLFEGLTTAYAKNTKFHRSLARIEKKELTYLQDYRNAVLSSAQYQQRRSEVYYAKSRLVDKWDPNRIQNGYLNASVGMMDGRVLNEQRNEFLSSYKLWRGNQIRTWNFNALVILLFALGINLITMIKLKYYFKE